MKEKEELDFWTQLDRTRLKYELNHGLRHGLKILNSGEKKSVHIYL